MSLWTILWPPFTKSFQSKKACLLHHAPKRKRQPLVQQIWVTFLTLSPRFTQGKWKHVWEFDCLFIHAFHYSTASPSVPQPPTTLSNSPKPLVLNKLTPIPSVLLVALPRQLPAYISMKAFTTRLLPISRRESPNKRHLSRLEYDHEFI